MKKTTNCEFCGAKVSIRKVYSDNHKKMLFLVDCPKQECQEKAYKKLLVQIEN